MPMQFAAACTRAFPRRVNSDSARALATTESPSISGGTRRLVAPPRFHLRPPEF